MWVCPSSPAEMAVSPVKGDIVMRRMLLLNVIPRS